MSPNDLADEVNEKRIEWLEAGAQLVWVIHPVQQTIHAYRADGTVTLFRRPDTLTADPVLPEFRVPGPRPVPPAGRDVTRAGDSRRRGPPRARPPTAVPKRDR